MNGIECLGEFHVFFSCLFVLFVCFALELWQLKRKEKKQVFPHLISYLSTPPPLKKKEIYRYIKFGVSDYLQYGGCAFHYFCMVFVMFLHPYNVDRWSLSGETYAKSDGCFFLSSIHSEITGTQ